MEFGGGLGGGRWTSARQYYRSVLLPVVKVVDQDQTDCEEADVHPFMWLGWCDSVLSRTCRS